MLHRKVKGVEKGLKRYLKKVGNFDITIEDTK